MYDSIKLCYEISLSTTLAFCTFCPFPLKLLFFIAFPLLTHCSSFFAWKCHFKNYPWTTQNLINLFLCYTISSQWIVLTSGNEKLGSSISLVLLFVKYHSMPTTIYTIHRTYLFDLTFSVIISFDPNYFTRRNLWEKRFYL